MLKYIELKTGHADNGPAWIANVEESKSGRSIYFNGMALKKRPGKRGNYRDKANGDEYWVANVKKNGADRHWNGAGKVMVERASIDEYLALVNASGIDQARFEISDTIVKTQKK